MKGWVLLASVMLHAVVVAALLPWPAGRASDTEEPSIEVELVQRPDAVQGAPVTASVAAAPSPPSVAEAASPPPPLQAEPSGAEPAAPVRGPSGAASPMSAPAVNLGNSEETREGVDVTGKGVIPARPDSAFRNLPPAYPAEAARQRAQGTVTLLIHVSAQGRPQDVVIASSSGAASLDRAARNAVRQWRFTPARNQGTPVPFDYSLDIRFVLGDKQ